MIRELVAFAALDALFWLFQGALLRAEDHQGRATVSTRATRAAAVHPTGRTPRDRAPHCHRRPRWRPARAAPCW